MSRGAVVWLLAALSGHAAALSADAPSRPLGLPPGDFKAQSQPSHMVETGRRLFFDRRLSSDGTVSCATCHKPELAFTDARPVALGVQGRQGTRNTPSLLNVAFERELFWDGRSRTLELQALAPLNNPREHNLASEEHLASIVRADPQYRREFVDLFDIQAAAISASHIGEVLAAYQRTLLAGDSPFDMYFYGGDRTALTDSAVRGLDLFRGRARCAGCHEIGEKYALFTDQKYHASIRQLPEAATKDLSRVAQELVAYSKAGNRQAIDEAITGDKNVSALGRFAVTLNPADVGLFKTPSLRNVALTAPYLHDGSYKTLKEVVEAELYVRGAAVNYPIVLTSDEKEDLVAFLQALSSPVVMAR